MQILVLHGPNLNLLGSREPHVYGSTTLAELENGLRAQAQSLGLELECFQSNHEGALIERVHAAGVQGVRYLIINPAAYTHTSVALRDALAGTGIPFVEGHLSNVHAREPFRQHWVAENSLGTIVGVMSAGRGVEPWERRIVGDAWFDSGAAYALSHLYLVPGVHGSGLAQEMLDVGLPERRPAYLWAYDDNLRARAFYRKNGFAPDGLQTLSGEHWGNMPMSRWVRPDVVRP